MNRGTNASVAVIVSKGIDQGKGIFRMSSLCSFHWYYGVAPWLCLAGVSPVA